MRVERSSIFPSPKLAKTVIDQSRRRSIFQMNVKSSGLLCDLPEAVFIQTGSNGLPVAIPKKLLALRVNRNSGAFLCADPNSKNANTERGSFLGRRDGVFLKIFAVGQQDQRAIKSFGFTERQLRGMDRGSDIGSAAFDCFCVKLGDCIEDRLIIDGQRSFDLCGPGESDQSNPIAPHRVQDILGGEFCSCQAIGSVICRQHALGGVDRQDDIAAVLLEILFDGSQLGAVQEPR